MTRREYELQQMLRASHARLKAANRRCDDLFARLTDTQCQISVLRAHNPSGGEYLDMRVRAATLGSTLQAMINNAGKVSRISGDAAEHAQPILDTASVDPQSEVSQ